MSIDLHFGFQIDETLRHPDDPIIDKAEAAMFLDCRDADDIEELKTQWTKYLLKLVLV